ncbi:MAG: ParB/RepB/Spo0J family partition protein [Chloroflexi bacterium]|jgi:ParB family chromosome partitioning protein|nr:ParB/RepB/Spo0J family partition protein [Chloroflexota bacterium]
MTSRSERHQGGLGRGLSALIPTRPTAIEAPTEIPLARIAPNPYQPRAEIAPEALAELAASIAEHGVLQPILVTETIDGYRLVAGERRVRASRLAGLERIPAVVRELADHDQLELALVENIQREDLDPLEEARAYRQLIDEFGFTQEKLAKRMGKARPTIANSLRLLELDPEVQAALAAGLISEGHARALGGLPTDRQARVLAVVIERELSVRQAEELVRRLRQEPAAAAATRGADAPAVDAELERVEGDLRTALGTKVSISRSRRGGRIIIEFYSDEELSRLFDRLVGGTE